MAYKLEKYDIYYATYLQQNIDYAIYKKQTILYMT